jgi:hypothetical protein
MNKSIGCFLVCLILAFPAFCEKDDLSIQVSPWDTDIRTTKPFDVKVYISNKSENDNSLGIFACRSWRTDNPSIQVVDKICVIAGIACKVLKPGEKIEELVTLRLSDSEKAGRFTFKLGFNACFCDGTSQLGCIEEKSYWSDPITIQVQ